MLLIAQHLGALSRRTMTMGSCGGDGGGEAKLDWHYRLIRTFNPKILRLWGAGSERPKLTKCRVKIFSVSSNETVVSESNTELAWMSSKLLSKPKILWVDEQSCSCCSCHWNLIYVPSLLELSPSAGSLLSAASGCLLPRFLLFVSFSIELELLTGKKHTFKVLSPKLLVQCLAIHISAYWVLAELSNGFMRWNVRRITRNEMFV